jgi:hypothetical protein
MKDNKDEMGEVSKAVSGHVNCGLATHTKGSEDLDDITN